MLDKHTCVLEKAPHDQVDMLRALNADDPTHGDVEMHDSDDAGGADFMHHAPTGVGDGQGAPKLNDLPNTPTPRCRAVTSRPRASCASSTAMVERAMPVPPTAPLEDSEHGRATLGQGVHRPAQEANYEMLDGERASGQYLDQSTVATCTHLAASTSAPASNASYAIANTRVCADTTTLVAAAAPAAVSPTAPSEAYDARACSTAYTRTMRATTAITSAPASRNTRVYRAGWDGDGGRVVVRAAEVRLRAKETVAMVRATTRRGWLTGEGGGEGGGGGGDGGKGTLPGGSIRAAREVAAARRAVWVTAMWR